MTPLNVTGAALGLWGLSWAIAAIWTQRTAARPSFGAQALYLVPTFFGFALIALTARAQAAHRPRVLDWAAPLWNLPPLAGWLLAGLCIAGVAFMWWARLTLGDLWSSSVTRKQDHHLVVRGPYRWVRHPIYTGLILGLACLAAELGSPAALAGVALATLGFWLKARLEERFLSAQLDAGEYAAYRKRTPMLIPFSPLG
jgi:protein-S-isoprenylcysteine O-methyltransferase Ste14